VYGEGLEIFEEDKNTTMTSIAWGTIDVLVPKCKYGWINAECQKIRWWHDAPSYLQLTLAVELSPNSWMQYSNNQTFVVNNAWTRFYVELVAQTNSTPGDFSFFIYFVVET